LLVDSDSDPDQEYIYVASDPDQDYIYYFMGSETSPSLYFMGSETLPSPVTYFPTNLYTLLLYE